MLIDTSVLVDLFRHEDAARRFRRVVGKREYALTRLTQGELLQGCRDEAEWGALEGYLDNQDYAEASVLTWRNAARTYFELRRGGRTVRSLLDCCIAEIAIEHRLTLIHNDRDFVAIAALRPLKVRQVNVTKD